jgi:hypothetical protein
VKLLGETAGPGAAERAVTLFSDIAAGNWHHARADFTDRMNNVLDEEELAAAWSHVTAEAGAYQGPGEPTVAQAGGLTNVSVLWRSIHFGTKQFRPCPVDHRWRFAVFVNPRELTDAERQQAEGNRI